MKFWISWWPNFERGSSNKKNGSSILPVFFVGVILALHKISAARAETQHIQRALAATGLWIDSKMCGIR